MTDGTTVVTVDEFGCGHRIVELRHPVYSAQEMLRMGCRPMNYSGRQFQFLRDPSGQPVAMLVLIERVGAPVVLESVAGPEQGRPSLEIRKLLEPYLRRRSGSPDNWKLEAPVYQTGLVQATDSAVHDVHALPEELEIDGSLHLWSSEVDQVRLPRVLKIGGNFELTGFVTRFLPDTLIVGGRLSIEYTRIRSLPAGIRCGSLRLSCNKLLLALPEGLVVENDVELGDQRVGSLGRGIHIGGSIDLKDAELTSIPDGTRIDRNLNLSNSRVRMLPENMTIGGSLNISGTSIVSLPTGLRVGWLLVAEKSSLASLPDDMQVGGDLMMKWSKIARLPDGLVVHGMLDVGQTQLTELPSGLRVEGDLYISGTGIETIPDDTVVDGFVFRREWDCEGGPKRKKVDGKWVPFVSPPVT